VRPSDNILGAFSVAELGTEIFYGGIGTGFFFSPFSGGLPMVNTRVFFSRPFLAGCPGLIPGFFFFFFFPALIRRAAHVCFHWGFFNEFSSQIFIFIFKKAALRLCVSLLV
jgi:hypothetical protein